MTAIPASAPTTGRVRWTLLLLASAALHAAILGGWRPAALPTRVLALGGDRTAPLSVTMVTLAGSRAAAETTPHGGAKGTTGKPPAQPLQRRPQRPAMRPAAMRQRAAPTPTQARRTAPAGATSSTAQSAGGTDHSAALAQQVVARIRGALARCFTYPPRARREGWQGAVLLRFRINSDGSFAAIRVAHSSGYALLDRAALGALHKVGRLPLDTALSHPLELQLPVIYHLEAS